MVPFSSPYLPSRRGLWPKYILRKITKKRIFQNIVKSNPIPFLRGHWPGIKVLLSELITRGNENGITLFLSKSDINLVRFFLHNGMVIFLRNHPMHAFLNG